MKYHTGIDMKAAQDLAPRAEPHGRLSNRPIPVGDNLSDIIRALGGDPKLAENVNIDGDTPRLGGEY